MRPGNSTPFTDSRRDKRGGMSEDSNKGLWGRLTGAGNNQEASLRSNKSLDTKFADPSFLSAEEPGFPTGSPQKPGMVPLCNVSSIFSCRIDTTM